MLDARTAVWNCIRDAEDAGVVSRATRSINGRAKRSVNYDTWLTIEIGVRDAVSEPLVDIAYMHIAAALIDTDVRRTP
ncbi:MAG: hypothetical protein LBT97_03205 [Planctomycetota bacterium]|nr:hypothetical protein [Planctomycetota bacterium]